MSEKIGKKKKSQKIDDLLRELPKNCDYIKILWRLIDMSAIRAKIKQRIKDDSIVEKTSRKLYRQLVVLLTDFDSDSKDGYLFSCSRYQLEAIFEIFVRESFKFHHAKDSTAHRDAFHLLKGVFLEHCDNDNFLYRPNLKEQTFSRAEDDCDAEEKAIDALYEKVMRKKEIL